MKLYDFSAYARRRSVRRAEEAVASVVSDLNKPGSVVVLKERVGVWFKLHQEILKTGTQR